MIPVWVCDPLDDFILAVWQWRERGKFTDLSGDWPNVEVLQVKTNMGPDCIWCGAPIQVKSKAQQLTRNTDGSLHTCAGVAQAEEQRFCKPQRGVSTISTGPKL